MARKYSFSVRECMTDLSDLEISKTRFFLYVQHFVLFLTWLVAYLIPDVPAFIQLLMQRELHLAKEARYSEAFSSLHEERRKTKTYGDLADDAVALRRGSHDAASPTDVHDVA